MTIVTPRSPKDHGIQSYPKKQKYLLGFQMTDIKGTSCYESLNLALFKEAIIISVK